MARHRPDGESALRQPCREGEAGLAGAEDHVERGRAHGVLSQMKEVDAQVVEGDGSAYRLPP